MGFLIFVGLVGRGRAVGWIGYDFFFGGGV